MQEAMTIRQPAHGGNTFAAMPAANEDKQTKQSERL
jgi:hypothetical protein